MIRLLPGFLGRGADWAPFTAGFESLSGGPVETPELFAPGSPLVEIESLTAAGSAFAARGAASAFAAQGAASADEDAFRVLIGYSLGGRIALHALLAAPERWRAAVIVSAHPGLESEAECAARLAHDEAWARRFESEAWDDLMTAWHAQPVFAGRAPTAPRREADFDRAALAHALRAWSLGTQENLRPALRALRFPVLWLAGAEDAKFAALGREAAAALPEGRFEVVAGCAHRVPWEAPDAFLAHCRAFIQSLT